MYAQSMVAEPDVRRLQLGDDGPGVVQKPAVAVKRGAVLRGNSADRGEIADGIHLNGELGFHGASVLDFLLRPLILYQSMEQPQTETRIMSAAIEINGLNKTYPGGHRALTDFSLTVNQGEIFGFLGPNGAGKTTTIKILLGLLSPTSGTVSILGGDPTRPATRTRVGYLPEVANYYEFMNVKELLRFYGRISGMADDTIARRTDELLDLVGLDPDARKRMLGKFSKGMLQRAGIAQALLHDPDLLILDEPMTGLDPLARLQMRDIITRLRDAGKTVFFSSHELSETEVVCNRFGILKQGRLRWCGQASDMVGDGEANLERIFLNIIQNDSAEGGEQ